jgi:D-alanine-D-alanine ligase
MSRRLRVLHLTHPSLIPPDDTSGLDESKINTLKTDLDVLRALRELGHEVRSEGIEDELRPVRSAVRTFKPHVVFNLVEGFAGLPELDSHVVSYLELMGVPYTGCNPRGLMLARGKALSKKLLHYHRIRTPSFRVFRKGRRIRRPRGFELPLIVKSLVEESSIGISQASLVDSDAKLEERVRFVHESVGTDAIAEEFIEGREIYQGLLGNKRLEVLPPWELLFGDLPKGSATIATEKVKHDINYQERRGIEHAHAGGLSEKESELIERTSKRIYRILGLDGYARIDYRLSADGKLYFLEANPNPEIARSEEFASAAAMAGTEYPQLVQRILNLALARTR